MTDIFLSRILDKTSVLCCDENTSTYLQPCDNNKTRKIKALKGLKTNRDQLMLMDLLDQKKLKKYAEIKKTDYLSTLYYLHCYQDYKNYVNLK